MKPVTCYVKPTVSNAAAESKVPYFLPTIVSKTDTVPSSISQGYTLFQINLSITEF